MKTAFRPIDTALCTLDVDLEAEVQFRGGGSSTEAPVIQWLFIQQDEQLGLRYPNASKRCTRDWLSAFFASSERPGNIDISTSV